MKDLADAGQGRMSPNSGDAALSGRRDGPVTPRPVSTDEQQAFQQALRGDAASAARPPGGAARPEAGLPSPFSLFHGAGQREPEAERAPLPGAPGTSARNDATPAGLGALFSQTVRAGERPPLPPGHDPLARTTAAELLAGAPVPSFTPTGSGAVPVAPPTSDAALRQALRTALVEAVSQLRVGDEGGSPTVHLALSGSLDGVQVRISEREGRWEVTFVCNTPTLSRQLADWAPESATTLAERLRRAVLVRVCDEPGLLAGQALAEALGLPPGERA